MDSYTSFFRSLLAGDGDSTITPRDWQIELAENSVIANRLISIPTGFGKTLGVLGAWLYNRLRCRNEDSPRRYQWPHRLVWCLPMRTLVEQTVDVARSIVEPFGIKVHTLMGGAECEDWHLYPQEDAILVGTQDMLISRAINRGYGASPARWPMYFALLNNDCLWVLDEIQLMDVALITTAQMQYFRQEDRPKTWQPAYSWWMSATLQPEWLVSVDNQCFVSSMANEVLRLTENDCVSPLWSEVTKPISLVTAADAKAEAELIVDNYQQLPQGSRSVLAVLNTVDKAVEV